MGKKKKKKSRLNFFWKFKKNIVLDYRNLNANDSRMFHLRKKIKFNYKNDFSFDRLYKKEKKYFSFFLYHIVYRRSFATWYFFTCNRKKVFNERDLCDCLETHRRLAVFTRIRDTVKFHLPRRIIQGSKRSVYLSNSTRGNRISREKQAVGEKSIHFVHRGCSFDKIVRDDLLGR